MQKKVSKIVLFAIFCSIFSESFSSVSRALDLARNIQISGGSEGATITIPSTAVLVDMTKLPSSELNEINIDINDYALTFISLPTSFENVVPLISDLSFIPSGTTKFSIIIKAYDNSGKPLETLQDFKNAVDNYQFDETYYAIIVDQNSKQLGSSIKLPIEVSLPLTPALYSNQFTSSLGVNSKAVFANNTANKKFSYPIAVTFTGISGWTSLSKFIQTYSATRVTTPSSAGTFTEFNFNINNDESDPTVSENWSGAYAFIQDPWNNVNTLFANGKGVAADISSLSNGITAAHAAGKVSLALKAVDGNGNFISDLTKTVPTTMYLYAFDQNDNIIGSPVSFPATNAVSLTGSLKFTTNTFAMGLNRASFKSVTYPFVITITNS